jgi:predicted transglutaminase-like cysteine proteinase
MQRFSQKLPLIISGIAAFAIGAAVSTLAATPNADALRFVNASFAPVGIAKPAPYGWLHFCAAQPAECEAAPVLPRLVQLTARSWTELNKINTIVNGEIGPISDEDHYRIYEQDILNWWTYPDDGKGNCNDYVLMKRKLLIEAGWPKAALLMTVVVDQHGEGHLILTVRTDRGDLILDNMRQEIVSWDRTGYRFVKRQSELDPNNWVAIENQGALRTAAAGNPRLPSTAVQAPILVDELASVAVEEREASRNDHEEALETAWVGRLPSGDFPADHIARHALAGHDHDTAEARKIGRLQPPDDRGLRHIGSIGRRNGRLAGSRHQQNNGGCPERSGDDTHRTRPVAAMGLIPAGYRVVTVPACRIAVQDKAAANGNG